MTTRQAEQGWTEQELATFGEATEVQIAPRRGDGSLRRYVPIWIVRVGADLYVRSAYGPDNPWYRLAVASGAGRLRTPGAERDVAFEQPGDQVNADVDAAYHAKYDRYGPAIVGTVVGGTAGGLTLRLTPQRWSATGTR